MNCQFFAENYELKKYTTSWHGPSEPRYKHMAVHVYNLLYKMADANIAVSDLNNYLPFHQGIDLERDELIERYFKLGLKYKEIYVFFFIEISVRYLKRILRQQQLGRRRSPSSPTMMFMKLCMRRLKVAEVLLVIDQCINDFVSVIILSSHEKQ